MAGKHEIKLKIDFGDGTPKWIKIPYVFGDILYVINDPDQKEYIFIGFRCTDGNITYDLDFLGEAIEVYDFETSAVKNIDKKPLDKEDGDVDK